MTLQVDELSQLGRSKCLHWCCSNTDPPVFGRHLNLSDCKLQKIEALDGCVSLTSLYLHENKIARIENLDFGANLTHLYIQDNLIECMENLEALVNLRKLFIGGNRIREVAGLENCQQLEELHVQAQRNGDGEPLAFSPSTLDAISMSLLVLNVQKNNIWQASQFAQCQALERLDLSMNKIESFDEMGALFEDGACMQVSVLEMKGNPIDRQHKFRDFVTLMSPTLSRLNGKDITQTERRFLVNREAAKARSRSRQFQQEPLDMAPPSAGLGQELNGLTGQLLMEPGDSDPVGDRARNRPHIDEIPRKGGGEIGEREMYSGGAPVHGGEGEKERLQQHMQYAGEVPQVAPRTEGNPEGGVALPTDQMRFGEVAGEIAEREDFLKAMHEAGRRDQDGIIAAQIAEKVQELEQLDSRIAGQGQTDVQPPE